jgi:hypothetical protein
VLAAPGLLSEVVYGWLGTAPALMAMIERGELLAWNLPLGAGGRVLPWQGLTGPLRCARAHVRCEVCGS